MIDPESQGEVRSAARYGLHYRIRVRRLDVADFAESLRPEQLLRIILRSDADRGIFDKANRSGLESPLRSRR